MPGLLWTISLALATPADDSLSAGMAKMKAGAHAEAVADYQACLAAEPTRVDCLWELGWAQWSLKDWEATVSTWSRVKELDPSHSQVDKWLTVAEGHQAADAWAKQSASAAPDTVRAPPPEGTTLRLRAVGDIMMGTTFPHATAHLPPEDGATMFASVGDWLRDADVTFGNLEGPLCDGGSTNKCGEGENCYAFRSPTRYGEWMKQAGFDLMSTANNHSGDFGESCRLETEQTLDNLGIAYSGRPGTVASIEVNGLQIGMLGFHTNPACHDVNDHETAAMLVRALARDHDIVIVSFHGGAEGQKNLHVPDKMERFYGEYRGHLRKFARVVIDAGADVVLGHGPHVPRGLEVVDGRLVAYSLGNFATYDRFNLSGHLSTSLVLEAVVSGTGELLSGRILPVRLEGRGIPAPDPEATAVDLMRALSEEDFGTRAPVIAKDGTFVPRG